MPVLVQPAGAFGEPTISEYPDQIVNKGLILFNPQIGPSCWWLWHLAPVVGSGNW